MISSYLLIVLYSKSVAENHVSDLLDLIRLRHRSFRLQIHNLLHIFSGEDVVIAPDTFNKPEAQ